MHQINLTATQARQNFYNLIDQVATKGTVVHIHKKNLTHPVVIKRANPITKANLEQQRSIVKQTAGSLKSSVGYQPDEMEQAAAIFVKDYHK